MQAGNRSRGMEQDKEMRHGGIEAAGFSFAPVLEGCMSHFIAQMDGVNTGFLRSG